MAICAPAARRARCGGWADRLACQLGAEVSLLFRQPDLRIGLDQGPQSRTIAASAAQIGTADAGDMALSPNVLIATLSAIFQLRATFRPTECLIGHA
jgi:hypothetical protein